jgi:hypothetical protein
MHFEMERDLISSHTSGANSASVNEYKNFRSGKSRSYLACCNASFVQVGGKVYFLLLFAANEENLRRSTSIRITNKPLETYLLFDAWDLHKTVSY